MQKSLQAALLALGAQAEYNLMQSVYDGYYYNVYWKGTEWSDIMSADEGWSAILPGNSMLVLQD